MFDNETTPRTIAAAHVLLQGVPLASAATLASTAAEMLVASPSVRPSGYFGGKWQTRSRCRATRRQPT